MKISEKVVVQKFRKKNVVIALALTPTCAWQALVLLQLLGWVFLPVFISSQVSNV